MLSQRQVSVGADDFTLQQYPTTKALSYGIAIGKIAGAMLADGLDPDLSEAAQDDILAGLDSGGMVRGLLSQIDQEKTPQLIKSMLRDAIVAYTVEGTTRTAWDDAWYEARFGGALDDLVELLMAVFEDNFVDVVALVKKKALGKRITRAKSSGSDNGADPSSLRSAETEESQDSFFG